MRINYLTYNIKEHNIVWFKVPFVDNGQSFWRRLYRDFKSWIKFLLHVNYSFDDIPKLKDVVFLVGTDNQQRALEPIYSKLDSSMYSIIDTRQENPFYPYKKYRHYSMLYVINLVYTYCFATRNEKRRIANHYVSFMYTIGILKCTEDILMCNPNVRLVVMANDHSTIYRSMAYMAPLYSVDTLYTQHCSIAYHFPSLQFSYSFLDGEETFEKYEKIGNMRGTIYISGNPRFDKIAEYILRMKKSDIIGIATNLMDDEIMVKQLCEKLTKSGYKLCVRPHPRQILSFYNWYIENGIEISNPKTETPFEFAARMRIIIAGETGLHFDAAMMGVSSICYVFDGKPTKDWYGYIKNGLIHYTRNEDELMDILKRNTQDDTNDNEGLLRWYNAAHGTNHEGHIGEQIKDFIISFIAGHQSEFDAKYTYHTEYADGDYTKKVYSAR